MPCVHWSGESWVSHDLIGKPTSPAACSMPLEMATVNGFSLVSGITKIFLPAMQALASNAGPGAWKVGSFECFSISAFASLTPSAAAGPASAASTAPVQIPTSVLIDLLPRVEFCYCLSDERQCAVERKYSATRAS